MKITFDSNVWENIVTTEQDKPVIYEKNKHNH